MVDSPEWPGLSVAGGCRIGLSTPDAGWQCWVERKDPPTGDTFPDAASSAVSFLSNEDMLPNDVHSARCPEALLGPLLQSCFPLEWLPARTGAWVAPPQVQDFSLLLVELHGVPVNLHPQPAQACLTDSMTLWWINHSQSVLCHRQCFVWSDFSDLSVATKHA